jgi:hypothetical protein
MFVNPGPAVTRANALLHLVEVFRCDTRGDLMHHGNARHAVAARFQQMHDVAASYEEAVRVAERREPVCHKIRVLHHEV